MDRDKEIKKGGRRERERERTNLSTKLEALVGRRHFVDDHKVPCGGGGRGSDVVLGIDASQRALQYTNDRVQCTNNVRGPFRKIIDLSIDIDFFRF